VGGRGFFARTALKSLQRPPPRCPSWWERGSLPLPKNLIPALGPVGLGFRPYGPKQPATAFLTIWTLCIYIGLENVKSPPALRSCESGLSKKGVVGPHAIPWIRQCIGMQSFSNSSSLLTISCSYKNFLLISQTVQELSRWHTHIHTQTVSTENNSTFATPSLRRW